MPLFIWPTVCPSLAPFRRPSQHILPFRHHIVESIGRNGFAIAMLAALKFHELQFLHWHAFLDAILHSVANHSPARVSCAFSASSRLKVSISWPFAALSCASNSGSLVRKMPLRSLQLIVQTLYLCQVLLLQVLLRTCVLGA